MGDWLEVLLGPSYIDVEPYWLRVLFRVLLLRSRLLQLLKFEALVVSVKNEEGEVAEAARFDHYEN